MNASYYTIIDEEDAKEKTGMIIEGFKRAPISEPIKQIDLSDAVMWAFFDIETTNNHSRLA
jgi:hypothetical protein